MCTLVVAFGGSCATEINNRTFSSIDVLKSTIERQEILFVTDEGSSDIECCVNCAMNVECRAVMHDKGQCVAFTSMVCSDDRSGDPEKRIKVFVTAECHLSSPGNAILTDNLRNC